MLQAQAIKSGALPVLKRVMNLPELNNFCLVGGTALALKYGHRVSVDLDFFSDENYDTSTVINALEKEFAEKFEAENRNPKWAIFCFINGIKTDIVHYPHKTIQEPDIIDGIRLYSSPDIAAMKINAILGRGKKKDFWNLAELLKHYQLKDLIAFHRKKYPTQDLLISIPQAITYFDDAEESEEPVSLKKQTWTSVKEAIQKAVRDYLA